jgi:uncharacterized protein involved in exopolysaccharide biosynthesis
MNFGAWIRISLASVGIALATYLLMGLLPKEYESFQSLYFPASQTPSPGGALAALQGQASDKDTVMPGLRNAVSNPLVGSGAQTASGILTSRTCLAETVDKLDLGKLWNKTRSKAIRELEDRVDVRVEKTGFLRITVSAESPALAVRILQTMHAHLKRRSEELTLNVARRNREFIEDRLAIARREVEQERERLSRGGAISPTADISAIAKVYWESVGRLDEAKAQERQVATLLVELEANLRRTLAAARGAGSDAVVLGELGAAEVTRTNTVLGELAGKLQEARMSLSDASTKFARTSAEYREIERRLGSVQRYADRVIADQERAINDGTSPQLSRTRAQLEALRASIRASEKNLSEFSKDLSRVPGEYAAGEDARARFAAALERRSLLEAEVEFARIAEARDPSRFEIVDAPMENPDPVGPRKALFAGLAFIVAFALMISPFVARKVREAED